MPIEPTTPEGRAALDAIRTDPVGCLAGFDYDGTLAPIVPDPTQAHPHPEVLDALRSLAAAIGTVAIVTGRPVQAVIELAALHTAKGLDGLIVVGHYGLERWDAGTGERRAEPPHPGLEVARSELSDLLAELGLADADIEDKGLSVAVHVRRSTDPAAAYARMVEPLMALAERTGLTAEPGRMVVELRPHGMDKGQALRSLVKERAAASVVFTGDDLGDLAAYDEVARLRSDGVPGLLVCSGSDEVTELADRADLVVDGPAGVAGFVRDLVDELR